MSLHVPNFAGQGAGSGNAALSDNAVSAITDNETNMTASAIGGQTPNFGAYEVGDFQYEFVDEEEEQKQHFSFKQWLYRTLHSWDFYAKPITLTFNKKPAFATVPGGLWSCTTILLYSAFIFVQTSMHI